MFWQVFILLMLILNATYGVLSNELWGCKRQDQKTLPLVVDLSLLVVWEITQCFNSPPFNLTLSSIIGNARDLIILPLLTHLMDFDTEPFLNWTFITGASSHKRSLQVKIDVVLWARRQLSVMQQQQMEGGGTESLLHKWWLMLQQKPLAKFCVSDT